MNSQRVGVLVITILILLALSEAKIFAQINQCPKKRDPFIALVDSNGKIKPPERLCPDLKKDLVEIDVTLAAIIWDENRPLAMINGKVYSEGSEIGNIPGLVLERIYPNSVIINKNGNMVTVPLRKVLKNE